MKNPSVAIVLVVLLAAAGDEAWDAWGQGRTGENRLAPTKENFARALNASINPAADQTRCLGLPLGDPGPERIGVPGLRQQYAPGQFVVVFSTGLQPSVPYEKRQEQLRKFDALVKIGFFQESQTTLAIGNGPLIPARQFTLTWKGWEHMSPDSPCFPYGRMDTYQVVDAVKLPPHPSGLEIWEITHKLGTAVVPEWSKDEGLRAAFGELSHPWTSLARVRLIRGKSDWLPETQVQSAARDPELTRIARQLDQSVPDPAESTISAAIDQYLSVNPNGRPRACFRLPYQDADEAGSWDTRTTTKPLHLDFYLMTGRPPDRQATIDTAMARMRALEKAGLAKSETLAATTFLGRPVHGGTRFTIAPELDAHMSNESPWCVIVGEWKMTAITAESARPGNRAQRRAKVRYALANAREWVQKNPLREIPELSVLVDHGLAAATTLTYDNARWRVSSFKIHDPQTAIWDGQTIIMTPGTSAVVTDSSGRIRIVQAAPTTEEIQRMMQTPPAPSIKRSPSAAPLPDQPAPPQEFRVGAVPLHVVAVYEGEPRTGSPGEYPPSRKVDVRVSLKAGPAILLLSAYDPVDWNIVAEKGVTLERVLVIGHHRQRVFGVSETIPVFIRSTSQNRGPGGPLRVTRETTRGEIFDHFESVRNLTGVDAATLQTSYTAGMFIVDGQRTTAKPKPASQGTAPPSSVGFQAAGSTTTKVFNGGLSVTYCCAGAYSAATANYGHVKGKVYFEMTLRPPAGNKPTGSYTGVGLTTEGVEGIVTPVQIFNAAQKYKGEVTFGIAADLNAGRLYAHANGEWIHGPPGNDGIPIKLGRELFAAVTISAPVERGESEMWTANFGATPFRFPVPADFRPYAKPDGSTGHISR